ncbi:MAG: HD domain-containing protein [Myxococcota bacterium]
METPQTTQADQTDTDKEGLSALLAAEALLLEATRLAWRWHGRQTRKGKATSYMSHLLQVEGLVLDSGGGPDEAIAALLHDSLEDADDPLERSEREAVIESRFGAKVLRIVLDCTDTTAAEAGQAKGPWRERKLRYLEQLRGAEAASLLVAACDKRHNLGDLVCDLRHLGLDTLTRFNAGGPDQVWYYESVVSLCRPAIPARLVMELDDLVRELKSFVDKS